MADAKSVTLTKRKLAMPHVYVLLTAIIALTAALTWVLPAGEFERAPNDDGRMVVIAGTYHAVERHPVGPFRAVLSVYEGMVDAADIIFFIFISFAAVSTLIATGAFHGLISGVLKRVKGKARAAVIPLFLVIIGLGSSTVGMFEEFMGFIPILAGLCIAMGYDAIVGLAIVAVGAGIGYAGAAMNPFTVGVAQNIAELPYMSGASYRIVCHLVMLLITCVYTVHYALRIQADPTRSLVYGDDFSQLSFTEGEESHAFGIRQKLSFLVFLATIAVFVIGVKSWGWYLEEIAGAFIVMIIALAIVMGWTPNDLMRHVTKGIGEIATACLMVGIARGIRVVLVEGKIIDTVVNSLASPLQNLPAWLAAEAMLVVQTLLNFVIPSGSGQAAASMPIMAPLADVLGISRQTAVLAFQFGDGLSNVLWPTAFAVVFSGIAGVKVTKWWRWFLPLFVLLFLAQAALIAFAVMIDY